MIFIMCLKSCILFICLVITYLHISLQRLRSFANCVVNNGLSEASKAQLVGRTGEEIVDADIAKQMKE